MPRRDIADECNRLLAAKDARLTAAEARVRELEEAMREIEAIETGAERVEHGRKVLLMGFGHALAKAQGIARNALAKGGEGGGE